MHLQLTATTTTSLPADFEVSGAMVDGRDAVLWSAKSEQLLRIVAGNVSRVNGPLGLRAIVGAHMTPIGSIEAVGLADTNAHILAFNPDGTLARDEALRIPVTPSQAVRVGSAWVIGGTDADTIYRILRVTDAGAISEVLTIPRGRGGRDRGPVSAHLSAWNDEFIVTLTRHPFTSWRITSGGDIRATSRTANDTAVQRALDSLSGDGRTGSWWVSIAAIPIDSATVQTIADVKHDTRLIVTISSSGEVMSVRPIIAPIGFIASDQAASRAKKVTAVPTASTVVSRTAQAAPIHIANRSSQTKLVLCRVGQIATASGQATPVRIQSGRAIRKTT